MSVSGTVNKRIQHIIQKICLFDDIMFSIMFGGDLERTQLLLRIVMGKPDLVVISCQAQTDIRNLYGRSVRLDILARDNEGRIYYFSQ